MIIMIDLTPYTYILYDTIYCDCCEKCIGILRKETYYFHTYPEMSRKILELKKDSMRHKIWSIENGKEQVYFDNVLMFFH